MRPAFSAFVALSLCPALAGAQMIRGLVRDSASRQPVPGVVVSLLDSTSKLLGRIITTDRGRFNIPSATAVRRLRLQRIGFRPVERSIRVADTGFTDVEVALQSLPRMLAPIKVEVNSQCPQRDDQPAAYALLDQARSGLLATVVARATSPAWMRSLSYERTPDDDQRGVQKVRIDSTVATLSFAAAKPPTDFIARGFVANIDSDTLTYYAPDADVLMSDDFSKGYCFRIVRPDRDRTGQVGLGFDPARRNRRIQAITGVLWVDTVRRALVDLEYRYLDLGRLADAVRPGGHVSFQEVRPGVVLIDRWNLRLPRPRADTVPAIRGINGQNIRGWYEPIETGAELAYARWKDSVEWHGRLGTLRATVLLGDSVARGMPFWLFDTDYRGTTDSLGRIEIPELLPGPYIFVAKDPELAAVGFSYVPSLRFKAVRDSALVVSVQGPTPGSFAFTMCGGGRHLIVGMVVTADGTPVPDAELKVKKFADQKYLLGDPDPITSGNTGTFKICLGASLQKELVSIVVRSKRGNAIVNMTPSRVVTPQRIVVQPPPG